MILYVFHIVHVEGQPVVDLMKVLVPSLELFHMGCQVAVYETHRRLIQFKSDPDTTFVPLHIQHKTRNGKQRQKNIILLFPFISNTIQYIIL